MKYLFFDVECSNCFNSVGKICEFGYVLTDEKFHVIQSDDIPMSPGKGRGNRFHLTGRKKQKDLILAYDENYYFSCPEFPCFYERIRKMMEDKDTLIFGYSVDNDIRYLDGTIHRYNLEKINFLSHDIQIMMKYYSSKQIKLLSLKDALIKLGMQNELVHLVEHLSRDDAMMSMLVVKAMCNNLEITLNQLIDLCPTCKIDTLSYINHCLEHK